MTTFYPTVILVFLVSVAGTHNLPSALSTFLNSLSGDDYQGLYEDYAELAILPNTSSNYQQKLERLCRRVDRALEEEPEWELLSQCGDIPDPRGGAKAIHVKLDDVEDGKLIWLAGGFAECFSTTAGCDHYWYSLGTINYFNTKTLRWTEQATTSNSNNGALPGKRGFFSAGFSQRLRSVVIYGGVEYDVTLAAKFIPLSDLQLFHVDNNSYTEIVQSNPNPGIRIGSSFKVDETKNIAILQGGLAVDPPFSFVVRNDVWELNLTNFVWRLVRANGAPGNPNPPTYLSGFDTDESLKLGVLYGGNIPIPASGDQGNITWILNTTSYQWTALAPQFLGRIHAAYGVYEKGNTFTVAFGDVQNVPGEENGCRTPEASAGQKPTDEVYVLNLKTLKWNRVFVQCGPGPLKRVSYAVIGKYIYVFVGYNFKCPDAPLLAGYPIWNTQSYRLDLSKPGIRDKFARIDSILGFLSEQGLPNSYTPYLC